MRVYRDCVLEIKCLTCSDLQAYASDLQIPLFAIQQYLEWNCLVYLVFVVLFIWVAYKLSLKFDLF